MDFNLQLCSENRVVRVIRLVGINLNFTIQLSRLKQMS